MCMFIYKQTKASINKRTNVRYLSDSSSCLALFTMCGMPINLSYQYHILYEQEGIAGILSK